MGRSGVAYFNLRKRMDMSENPNQVVALKDYSAQNPSGRSTTGLCELCSHGLILDDSHAGGVSRTSPGIDESTLSFPEVKKEIPYDFLWVGGNVYSRIITSPDLPELSSPAEKGCRFCAALKSVFLHRYGNSLWWTSSTSRMEVTIEYQWSGNRNGNVKNDMDFSLRELLVTASHPGMPDSCQPFNEFKFQIGAHEGEYFDSSKISINDIGLWQASVAIGFGSKEISQIQKGQFPRATLP